MTKSTITRERIQRIMRAIDSEAYDEEEIREWLSSDEIMELARMALATMGSEPVVPIWGATKYPVSRPVPGAKLIVWDDTGKFVGYGSAVDTRESGVAIQMSDGRRFDSNHDLRWQYALQPVPVVGSEPVAWDYEWASCITCEGPQNFNRVIEREAPPEWAINEGQARNIIPLYRHAQPAPERDQVRSEHAEWSQATFGNVGPVGPLKHLSKEALEAAAEPGDLSEWADMQLLLWDAQRRAGITDEQITQAMIEKLVVNKQREWPEPKDGEPRLHIKAQPAPVVPDERPSLNNGIVGFDEGWNACRAAMLAAAQPAPVVPEEMPCGGAADDYHDGYQDGWNACRAAMLQAGDAVRDLSTPVDPQVAEYEQNVMHPGNSPVIPDGYVMVPKEPTEDMLRASYRDASVYSAKAYRAMLAAAPQDTPALDSVQSVVTVSDTWIPVSERMPEDEEQYYLTYSEGDGVCRSYFFDGYFADQYVTHWMPLPAAPQEVKGE